MASLKFTGSLLALLIAANFTLAEDPIVLKESFKPGTTYHISSRTQLSGRISIPLGQGQAPKTVNVQGLSASAYLEEVLGVDSKLADGRTVRYYESIDFRKTVGDVDQQTKLRTVARQLVFLEQRGKRVPFCPSGPLTWNEIEMLRTEIFVPSLVGLLPTKEVRLLDTWKLPIETARDLTDLEKVDETDLVGRFVQASTLNSRRVAEISISGSAKGVNEDGSTKHTLKGTVFFDLDAKAITYLSLLGEQELYDQSGKATGKIEGRYVLTREPKADKSLMPTTKLSVADLEPNENNSRLLYENGELGVSFQYPRRWHISQTRGRQITIDEPGGGGILLTAEVASKIPTPEKYEREVSDFLRDRKLPTRTIEGLRKLDRTGTFWHFALEAQEQNQRPILDYYVASGRSYGATVAGRSVGVDAETLRKEIEGIVRSLKFRE